MSRMACVIALAAGVGFVGGFGITETTYAAPLPAIINGLQIAVSSTNAATVSKDGSVSLDVTFKGGNLRSVELHLDGFLIKKQAVKTREKRGVITFALDGLTDGTHEVLVKATDVDGSTATTTTSVTVGLPTPEETIGGSGTRFTGLNPNQMVQGIVPIQLEVETSINSPYVTYLIDNEFIAFMNYAPFVYNLDTTRLSNGVHTIGVEINDGESLTKVRSLSMKINVNNSGGFTKIKRDTNPLKETLPPSVAEASLPSLSLLPMEEATRLLSSRIFGAGNFETRSSSPSISARPDSREPSLPRTPHASETNNALLTIPAEATLESTTSLVRGAKPAPLTFENRFSMIARPDGTPLPTEMSGRTPLALSAPGTLAALSNSEAFESSFTSRDGVARLPIHLKRNGNVATLPAFSLNGETNSAMMDKTVTGIALNPNARKMSPSPKLRARMSLRAMSSLKGGFSVLYDLKEVNFDVNPHVENGVPLAPLRHIFEASGGEIAFYAKTKTVRAVSKGTEIQIRIGHRQAKVNAKTVRMETAPYLEKGRTMVPVSFIQEAMNVNVSYDPSTGHLLIESKK